MRLFLGIEIPPDIKNKIHHFLGPLQKSSKGWEHPHDYHQTLLFIGESSEEDFVMISQRLKQVSFHPFELSFDQFQFFNRRIMYLGLKPSADLLELKKLVNEVFPEWVKPESKPFIPHITVKRWQRYEYNELSEGLFSREFVCPGFVVTGIALFKSEKDKGNQKYHIIEREFF